MRHTFATLLAESGASLDAISRILGHSGGGSPVTRGYVHSGLEFLSRELEKLRLMPGQAAHVLRIADYRPTV
jgi:integrase